MTALLSFTRSLYVPTPAPSHLNATPKKEIPVTDESIASMLETAFVKSCLELATGRIDVLKLFLAACSAAYQRRIPLPRLSSLLADCPEETAGRQLSEEEVTLRETWIALAYLTLERIDVLEGNPKEDMGVSNASRTEWGAEVEREARKLVGLEAEEGAGAGGEGPLFAYGKKVIELTVKNVEDVRFANEEMGDGVGPPHPRIPGAY